MPAAADLLQRWMTARKIPSLAAAAHRLGKAGAATVSNWRSGYAKPDNESIAIMCEESGENPAEWVARLNLEFERSPRMRAIWESFLKLAACFGAVYAFSRLDVQTDTVAALLFAARNPSSMYIM